jgi:hypothetical protein
MARTGRRGWIRRIRLGTLVNRAAVVPIANAAHRRAGDAAALIIVAALRPADSDAEDLRVAYAVTAARGSRGFDPQGPFAVPALARPDRLARRPGSDRRGALAAAVERVESMPERHRRYALAVLRCALRRRPLAETLGLSLPPTLADERKMWGLAAELVRLDYDERASQLDRFRPGDAGSPGVSPPRQPDGRRTQ